MVANMVCILHTLLRPLLVCTKNALLSLPFSLPCSPPSSPPSVSVAISALLRMPFSRPSSLPSFAALLATPFLVNAP